MAKKQEDKIYSILSSIDKTLKLQNSSSRILLQGLLRGFGTALGATVLLAIATSLTIQAFDLFSVQSFADYVLGND